MDRWQSSPAVHDHRDQRVVGQMRTVQHEPEPIGTAVEAQRIAPDSFMAAIWSQS